MMLVRCTSCNALVGFGNNLTFGPDTELVCFECAGDQVFGSGKDGTAVAAASADTQTRPVPANPVAAKSFPPDSSGAHPSNGGGARFFGGPCIRCGRDAMLPFEPSEPTELLVHSPKYTCSDCYRSTPGTRTHSFPHVGGEGE